MSAIIFRFALLFICLSLASAVIYSIAKRRARKPTRLRLFKPSSRPLNFQLLSLDATASLTLWSGGRAEVRRVYRLGDTVLSARSEGVWEFDRCRRCCRVNIDGHQVDYLLLTPSRSFNCILIAGDPASANLAASWFAESGGWDLGMSRQS